MNIKEKYFSIIVMGKQSSEAEEGELNKSTGMPLGPTTKIRLQVGSVAIPNFSRVWARRVKDKKEALTGELEFLKWGDKGGEAVPIRYLEGIPSLDKNFQKNVLKIEQSEEEANLTAYIDLDIGVNDFDMEVADPLFVTFLEHHTYNEDNISRKPNSLERHFKVYDPKKMNGDKIEKMRKEKKAQDFVLAAEGDTDRLVVMAKLFDLDPQSQNEVIFNDLLEILEDDIERILNVISSAKEKFRYHLQSLEDKKFVEFTIDGDLIEIVDDKREFLVKGLLDDKDKAVKDYVAHLSEGILEPEYFKVYDRVLEIQDQLLALLQ